MKSTITCPKCGELIELTQAITDGIQKEVVTDLEKKFHDQLRKATLQTEETLKKEFEEKSFLEVSDLKKQLDEKNRKVHELQEYELKLREQKRKLEDKEKELMLETARILDEERNKLEVALTKQLTDEYHLKELDKDKKISDMEKLVEELKRKAQQGSQQSQGEVQELDLERTLRETFTQDLIEPIGKGVRGADVRQIVKTGLGNVCGVILWESKRTKAWSDEWIGKLKGDLREEKANLPIIVSTVLPEEAKSGFGFKDGVIICSYALILPVAEQLRQRLIDIAREKFIAKTRDRSKAEDLYDYIVSHEFKQQMEIFVETFNELHDQIKREKVAYERMWKVREAHITKLLHTTANIIGSMQGRVGQSTLQVKGLDLLDEPEEILDESLKLIS